MRKHVVIREGLNLAIDFERRVVTINGVDYAFGFFDVFGSAVVDKPQRVEVIKNEDGVVTLRPID